MGQARDRAKTHEERAAMAIERDRLIKVEEERQHLEKRNAEKAIREYRRSKIIAIEEWLEKNYEFTLKVMAGNSEHNFPLRTDIDDVVLVVTPNGELRASIADHETPLYFELTTEVEDGETMACAQYIAPKRKQRPSRSMLLPLLLAGSLGMMR